MRNDYDSLKTEERNINTAHIDECETLEMMRLINDEDAKVASAVRACLKDIARATDIIANAMKSGGSLIYIGAGTSGRLGILDASECPPTYGVSPSLVRGIIAGGNDAVFRSVEGAEDSESAGRAAIDADGVCSLDVVVGISASGGAPFVRGAVMRAKEIGAKTISLSCNPEGCINSICDVAISPLTGPEVISGSTRMKAGTAQKMVLNMLSTGAMIKTGRVVGNLMVNVAPTNEKLTERACRIISELSGANLDEARAALEREGDVRAAISAIRGGRQ